MNDQVRCFGYKLVCETGASDLCEALKSAESIVVADAHSPQAFAREHIPRVR